MKAHVTLAILAALAGGLHARPAGAAAEPAGPRTHWSVSTSQGFDALCALNLLSGDPYYIAFYPVEAREFASPAYAGARRAAVAVRKILKDENGEIVSAFLTLVFSGGPDSTLDAVLASAREPSRLEARFRASPYGTDESWALFLRVRPMVVRALAAMRRAGFARDWRRHMRSAGAAPADSLLAVLRRYDVLSEQERLVGHPLQDGRIDVVLLCYSMPHGIRIQGARFLTNVGYPVQVVLRNAAHEPLHPPFDRSRPDVSRALHLLSGDSLITRIVRTHDRTFGYTSVDGYVEEDAVQAMEQVVSERLGFSNPAGERWRESDDGMHVLAAAIYSLMNETGFASRGGSFEDWFAHAVATGRFSPGEIERHARSVMGESAVRKWLGPARDATPPAR